LDQRPSVATHDLATTLAKPRSTRDRSKVPGARNVDCLRRKQESNFHLKAIAPAASTNAIPKGASPSREGALRTTAAGGLLGRPPWP